MVELNQYYTPEVTSFFLAAQLEIKHVKTCLELSAGEGALIEPIKKLNPSIEFTTVDLDPKNTAKLRKKYPKDIHICKDALDLNLGIEINSYDLAICNPPFAYVFFNEINNQYIDSCYLDLFKNSKKVRTEILFILKNLLYIKKGGTLAIIVPDLIFSSYTFSNFRRVLFSENSLIKIIECEHKIFKKTEAKTYILFIKKEKPKNSNEFIPYIKISQTGIQQHNFLVSSTFKILENKNLKNYIIFRGSNSSKECRATNRPFHHNYSYLEDFSEIAYPFLENDKVENFKYAIPGDILIHRVGRNIGKTVYLIDSEVIISDCIIAIRFKSKKMRKSFINAWVKRKQDWIKNNSKGTCAKNISIHDIRNFISSI
ncbi:N-6 DNA methylase [Shewanella sp. FDAARGOS_354]|uniref:N-6 DNA methylase n=1 Tax=Shewanella sp. FDAARGOS_354 TaxID=1930557 RepID=UPI000B51BEA5|nr:N-6 DNA methylase [Shewanella sp. FDAARGOS_354]ASF15713.1 SAM-dependent DNA methyltransferase [Shewanella sp. FDAARGOS_354]